MQIEITTMKAAHWPEVSRIYAEGIQTGIATFEKCSPSWEAWDASHTKSCRLVATNNGDIAGWAALSVVSSRCIYAGVAEVSVYVGMQYYRRGIGEKLLNCLIVESEKNNIWMLNASVFPENQKSIFLHKKCGFREIGYKEKVGKMSYGMHAGKWMDNVLLERRSKLVGIE